MTYNPPLSSLKESINEIKTALFFSEQDAVMKFPVSVITCQYVDDAGQIWFFMNRPSHSIEGYDKSFPAKLDFFKKGCPRSIQLKGYAYIVHEEEVILNLLELTEEMRAAALGQHVLIKFVPAKAEQFELETKKPGVAVQKIESSLQHLFFSAKHQYTDSLLYSKKAVENKTFFLRHLLLIKNLIF
jgi:general stress protein 26